jgi:hypothetical protein
MFFSHIFVTLAATASLASAATRPKANEYKSTDWYTTWPTLYGIPCLRMIAPLPTAPTTATMPLGLGPSLWIRHLTRSTLLLVRTRTEPIALDGTATPATQFRMGSVLETLSADFTMDAMIWTTHSPPESSVSRRVRSANDYL